MILINNLQKALNNAKTPNDILLNILNLSEFFERRNVHLKFIDYKQFGNIAYKCRAFAKALYYKENDFTIRNYFDHFEDLLDLYYELKHPESAIGLLKLAEINKDKFIYLQNKNKDDENIYNNQYILYMKLHEYDKALKMITDNLAIESNQRKIDILEKNRDICLDGLCDWEQLFDNEETANFNLGYDSESKSESESNSGSLDLEKEKKEEEEKIQYHYDEKNRHDFEKEYKAKLKRLNDKIEMKKFLDMQIAEKNKEKNFNKLLDQEQARIWKIDLKKRYDEMNKEKECIKKMNRKNFECILKQIEQKKRSKSNKNIMTENEYAMNRNLLEKANEDYLRNNNS